LQEDRRERRFSGEAGQAGDVYVSTLGAEQELAVKKDWRNCAICHAHNAGRDPVFRLDAIDTQCDLDAILVCEPEGSAATDRHIYRSGRIIRVGISQYVRLKNISSLPRRLRFHVNIAEVEGYEVR